MTDKVFGPLFLGPLFLSSFDAANAEWYEEMLCHRESERWSRETWEKNKEALESLLNSSGDEGKVGPDKWRLRAGLVSPSGPSQRYGTQELWWYRPQ